MSEHCPECGGRLAEGRTCADDFHQLLFWENERPELGAVHHLMVLCYHLQHPSLYTAEGLRHARRLLADFVAGGLSPEDARRRQKAAVASGQRDWSITARPGDHGVYAQPPAWTMRVQDVVGGGIEQYTGSVQRWAAGVCEVLERAEPAG